jgi:hypothetical protein
MRRQNDFGSPLWLRIVAVSICRRRTLPPLGEGGQQRADALPMSQLSLSIDLKSCPVAVSPRHVCLPISNCLDGHRRIFTDAPTAVGSLFGSSG